MRYIAIVLFLIMLLIASFVALNWTLIMSPADISLGVTYVSAPLGLILVVLLLVVSAVFVALVAYLQISILLETRRQSRELSVHRKIADEAEASRFTSLQQNLEARFATLAGRDAQSQADLLLRIDRLESDLRLHIDQTANGLAATVGELDDRMSRLATKSP